MYLKFSLIITASSNQESKFDSILSIEHTIVTLGILPGHATLDITWSTRRTVSITSGMSSGDLPSLSHMIM
jgi:hypothetical protein